MGEARRVPERPTSALSWLFQGIFADHELRSWLKSGPHGEEVVAALPGPGVPLSQLAFGAVEVLERRGLVREDLFARLLEQRPERASEIGEVAGRWGLVGLPAPAARSADDGIPPRVSAMPDALIITALKDELDALLTLEIGWTTLDDPKGFPYHLGALDRTGRRPLRVAAAWSGAMGELAAAERARNLVDHLSPGCLAMCGICAGHPKDTALGDVVVADRVFNYDHGKLVTWTDNGGTTHSEIFHDLQTYNLDARWKVRATSFAGETGWRRDLEARRPRSMRFQRAWLLKTLLEQEAGGAPPEDHPDRDTCCPAWGEVLLFLESSGFVTLPPLCLTDEGRALASRDRLLHRGAVPPDPPFQVHLGPIATGSKVIQDPELFGRLKRVNRKVLGVEMEANAIGFVAEQADIPSLVVKAVSDFGDGDKDDSFRAFACEASARFLVGFLAQTLG